MNPDFEPFPGCDAPEPGAEGAWIWRSSAGDVDTGVLTRSEKARVARLVSEHKRAQLRCSLIERRWLLARLLNDEAADISISYGEEGKPFLSDCPGFEISFSDSEGMNALAFVRSGHVGIDIEKVRPIAWETMLSMVSEDGEAELIRNTIETTGEAAIFLKCWTAKEAILKAVGTGLKGGAPRVGLPRDFIAGQANQFRMEHEGMMLKVQSLLTGDVVLSRALSV